jgi:hypothetical protein
MKSREGFTMHMCHGCWILLCDGKESVKCFDSARSVYIEVSVFCKVGLFTFLQDDAP